MAKNKEFLGVAFSFDDMCAIGAAVGAAAVQLMKQANDEKDVKEAMHLTELYFRIDAAIRKAAEEIKVQRENDMEGN